MSIRVGIVIMRLLYRKYKTSFLISRRAAEVAVIANDLCEAILSLAKLAKCAKLSLLKSHLTDHFYWSTKCD
jgi:hypothetical protein